MQNIKNIIFEIKNTGEIKGLIEVYEEIAATRMQKIRSSVTAGSDYFSGLAKLSDEVALDLANGFGSKGKNAAVFLSADTGLYGDLIDKIMVTFVDFVKKQQIDAYVVGSLGVSLIRSYAPEIKINEILLPADEEFLIEDQLGKVMQTLEPYTKVYIFHGKFASIARQDVLDSVISGSDISKYGVMGKSEKEIFQKRFVNIYEPSVDEVGRKFAHEISTSILDASIKENQLAKYAARLMHLDSAINNIEKKLDKLDQDKKRMRKKIEQKKQTERTARWQRV